MTYHELGMTKAERPLVRRNYKEKFDWRVWAPAILFVASVAGVLYIITPTVSHAQQTGPRNNKEVCEDIRDGHLLPPAGHIADTVKLCTKLGIKI